ncbi:MAG: histidine kinase dimerization/phospho-acceptor domain-containing protein [Cyanobacteria bacterium P01_C01_bin.120]
MTLPPLANFICLIPASAASASPSRWLEDCLQSGMDFLVLLDEAGTPTRGLALNQLLGLTDSWSISSTDPHLHTSLDQTTLLSVPATQHRLPEPVEQASVPLELIELTTTTVIAVQRLSEAPERWWAVVDEQRHYQGLLDKSKLLAAAVREEAAAAPAAASTPATFADHQAFRSNTDLLTYLGHELKTPLTSLLGLSSLLKMGGENLTQRQTRYATLIQQHCRRLAAWVNTLIDLGRIESGSLRLVPQLIDLHTVWSEAYAQAALRVGFDQPPSPPEPAVLQSNPALTLIADQTRLRQMLGCLMQIAMVSRESDSSTSPLPLQIMQWQNWIGFAVEGVAEAVSLEHLSQAVLMLPFMGPPPPATPISTEIGHWLEWLLARKLAQLHRGELVLMVRPPAVVCPTLLLPTSPLPAIAHNSRFLLAVAPLTAASLETLRQQADQLNYQLFLTPQINDALEIATQLPIAAVLVLLQSQQMRAELQKLKAALADTDSLVIALVPPHMSAYLGELPVDRELLWPTGRLGSVLLQPSSNLPAPSRLTLLYLRSGAQPPPINAKFPHIFHDFGCRVLEVDDLEQASLLCRVWKPNVAVLDPAIAAPQTYLQALGQIAELTTLPIITLTMAATHAAHAITNISVYPCLVEEASWDTPEAVERMTAWLVQALQIAAIKGNEKR